VAGVRRTRWLVCMRMPMSSACSMLVPGIRTFPTIRLAGRGGGGEDVVKAATKAMHGLRPKSLMVFLAQEIVRALRIGGLRGVGNGIQVYRANAPRLFHAPKKFHFDYDEFWLEAGGELAPDGWFTLPLKTQPRADEDIPGHKRSMYRKRYALLEDLSRQIKIQLMPFHT